MAPITIPKTPTSAYNPQRVPNALILAHVRELQRAVKENGGTLRNVRPKTEEEAAAHIRHLTRALHQHALLPEVTTPPVERPASRRPAKARPRAKKKRASKTRGRRSR